LFVFKAEKVPKGGRDSFLNRKILPLNSIKMLSTSLDYVEKLKNCL
jgi:hypothetical protein